MSMQAVVKGVVSSLEKALDGAGDVSEAALSTALALLQDVTLHDYQLEGIKWLGRRELAKLNVILGDEMGLGKTLQTIAFMCYLDAAYHSSLEPCLIMAPLSVLPNWREQLTRFAPHLSVMVYMGEKTDRHDLQKKFNQTKPRVLLTSYELALIDTTFLKATRWSLAVFDEGHRLKNSKAKLYVALTEEFRFDRKLLLTGTPVQNNMDELAALLAFLNPTFFTPSVCQALRTAEPPLLRAVLSPVLLLRTVQDVQATLQLPPLTKVVIHTGLSPMQRAYYKEIVSKGTTFHSDLSLMNILAQLRKACNHPYLFPNAEPEPFQEGPHLYRNSGKLFALHTLLPVLKARGHVVLLFSTSTQFLDIIQDYCTWQHHSYERLDGSVRGEERWQTIDRFRREDSTFLFLLSTRAGGVGLNLQRADTVIFCDVDYNPQMELQALARAYRMGQTQPIHVMHLVCAHSVEEIIYKRSLAKLKLSQTVRECSKTTVADDESVEEMLQYGLHHVMEQADDAELEPLSEEQVETILKRGESATVPVVSSGVDATVENMYYFEGCDYSKQDLQSLRQLKAKGTMAASSQRKTRTAKYDESDDDGGTDDDDVIQVDLEVATRQRIARKQALFAKHNYTSYVVATPADEDEDFVEDEDEYCAVEYKAGNAAMVQVPPDQSPVIIVHCVDTSGSWTPRGFFGAISHRSKVPEDVYARAKACQDLKLGQAHCVPIGGNVFVCLLVVQSFLHQKKKRTAKTLALRLNALQVALAALAAKARELRATVHMPRLGAGTPGFNWYAVERLVKKHLRQVPTTVYYFTPSAKRQKTN
ncbi:Aste57867_454 [Aphanomyces stellatus]|uniref:Aste57867_454 protein n=1 Tax=Aphanomyces stellatus TaxID=120398 RepID=A0A485K7U7_9STRA|nr:hypothetical protein As57867_000453 [Aphanomyces stellatus]VFT77679.1 Aste57867_454 [Aphanomyces stellatus]